MKVLIVNDYGTPTGGAEIQSLLFRDLLRQRGHDALMFTSNARPGGVDIASDVTCFGTQGAGRKLLQAFNPWAAAGLRRLLRTFRPDVVHLRMFHSQLSPLILKELRGTPTLLHVVNYQLICPLNTKRLPNGNSCTHRAGKICQTLGCVSAAGRARFALQRRTWDNGRDAIDLVVANSQWTASRLTGDGVPVEEHVRYGVPPLGPRPPLDPVPTAAFVGRLFAQKGVDVLLRAMRLVQSAVPDARLQIIGDGPERSALQRLIAELHLGNAATMHGFIPRNEIPQLLGGAWLQVLPSVYEEPFGVVTIEAMMRGTALIATNAGGPSEVVREGETGLLVPPNDAAALAAAMVKVLRDRAYSERLGAAGYEIARREFTESVCMDRVLVLYQRTMERYRRKHS